MEVPSLYDSSSLVLTSIGILLPLLLFGAITYFPIRPTSYPGDPRQPTTRAAKWRKNTRTMHHDPRNWTFKSNSNQNQENQKVLGDPVGRQFWSFARSTSPSNDNLKFDPETNPNSSDRFLRSQHNPCMPQTIRKLRTAEEALRDGILFFKQLQCDDGHWAGDYGGPMFLLPGMVITSYITGVSLAEGIKDGMITYLLNHQQCDGGWGTHIEGASTMFGTVLSYVTLRLLGLSPSDPQSVKARDFIHQYGGAVTAPSWAKFWLSIAGLHDWKGCDSVPPELWLLPRWFPFHPGRLWCHCRMVYLPMSYLYGVRFQPKITPLLRDIRNEIYIEPYDSVCWSKARVTTVADIDLYSPLTAIMRVMNYVLSIYENFPVAWIREKGLKFAIEYIYAEDIQTNYICIGPVNKMLNMVSVYHNDPNGEEFKMHIPRLQDYIWVAEDGVKMQGYNGSQMWDTSFAAQALLASGLVEENADCLREAHKFMEATQIRDNEKDYEKWFRHVSKGGWPFSTVAHGWPISDCTAEGLKTMVCLQSAKTSLSIPQEKLLAAGRFYDAVNVILTLQNYDGGWATYENNRGYGWYEWLNPSEVFGDIMIDYSYVECTSACISALATFAKEFPEHRSREISRSIYLGGEFILSIQRSDGSFYGSWGVCFTYGTWFGITGLIHAGCDFKHKAIVKAVDFLLSKQREDGGWSESYLSCVDKLYTEHPQGSQVVQTAWALLGLMEAKCENYSAIERGVSYLMKEQLPSGDWPQQGIAGVFNRNCGITYTSYRNTFPIWALGKYFQLKNSGEL